MWSDAVRLLLKVTPRILSEVSWVMSGSGGGRVFNFPRLLSRKKTSVDLDLFRLRLLSAAQATILSISEALVMALVAGMTRYVSSANLKKVLSGLSGLRSAAVTVYAAGPTLEPCMILAVMLLVRETSPLNTV